MSKGWVFMFNFTTATQAMSRFPCVHPFPALIKCVLSLLISKGLTFYFQMYLVFMYPGSYKLGS